MNSTNPALANLQTDGQVISNPMTISGTINKTLMLLGLTFLSAAVTFTQAMAGYADKVNMFIIGGFIIGLILALVIIFNKKTAPYLAPFYAFAQGAALGGLTAYFEVLYKGIAIQAVSLTFLALFMMLGLYKAKLIRATEKFRSVMMIAMGAIFVFYIILMISSFFGSQMLANYTTSSSPLSIGISLVIVCIAALSFILDFDMIEQAAANYLPKYYEWYCGFGLLVTLIWLYMEILRLLSKFRSR